MSKQELEPVLIDEEDIEFDPDEDDEEVLELVRQPDGTFIYDPDEEPTYDPKRKTKKRRRKSAKTKIRYIYKKAKSKVRRPSKKGALKGIAEGFFAFASFWWFGLLFASLKHHADQGLDELKKYLFSPMWQIKDAITTITTPKSIESRFQNLGDNPLPIVAILGGLIAKYIPFRIKYKGTLAKILFTFGVFSLIGALLDPTPNGDSKTNTSSVGTKDQKLLLAKNPYQRSW